MSRQLTFSATVCALTMALFALTVSSGAGAPTSTETGPAPFAFSAALD